jgi:hypothetical protein
MNGVFRSVTMNVKGLTLHCGSQPSRFLTWDEIAGLSVYWERWWAWRMLHPDRVASLSGPSSRYCFGIDSRLGDRRYFLPDDHREFIAAIACFAPPDAAWAEALRAQSEGMTLPARSVNTPIANSERAVGRSLENELARRYQQASEVKTDGESIRSQPPESAAGGSRTGFATADTPVERLDRRELALRLAGVAICFVGVCLVFLPWLRVWAVGENMIDPKYIYADGTFGFLSGIHVQVTAHGYHLWQGLFGCITFLLLGVQLLATLESRRPASWWYATIAFSGLAIVMLSASAALHAPLELGKGSVRFPIFAEQEREFYDRLFTKNKTNKTAGELLEGLRREGMFDLNTIRSKVLQGQLKLNVVPRLAPWLSAGLGVGLLMFLGVLLAVRAAQPEKRTVAS